MENKQIVTAFSGFGGQGMLLLGKIVAEVALQEGKHVTWMPSYGAEMRGGTANCTVIYSENEIGSPLVKNNYDIVVAMNLPSVAKFEQLLRKDGMLIINSDIVTKNDVTRKDIKVIEVPATKLSNDAGSLKVQNIVMLGALAQLTGDFDVKALEKKMKDIFTGKKEKFVPMNIKAIELGMAAIK